jgi:SAM-dependent methyltransferase
MRGGLIVQDHDRALASGFDAQAPKFEIAPVQSDPAAIARLVHEAGFPPNALVLDAGCGPGLVSAGLLEAGCRVVGVDLSAEMIERARKRCAGNGARARFLQASVFDQALDRFGPFDGALSRFVLHHVIEPPAFLARQVALLRGGGLLVLADHTTDPDPEIAAHHNRLEVARDRTHTRNLTGGEIVDLIAAAGLSGISLREDSFVQDFDEWFDRGTSNDTKESVREKLLSGPAVRSFRPRVLSDGSIRLEGVYSIVRGVKP